MPTALGKQGRVGSNLRSQITHLELILLQLELILPHLIKIVAFQYKLITRLLLKKLIT
jgi:hypothetical protein